MEDFQEPTDEWLVAISLDRRRRYIVHLTLPIFLGQVLAT